VNARTQAQARRAQGLCIAEPRPIGCKIVAPQGESFCGYCQRLIDDAPTSISRRRAKRRLTAVPS